MVDLNNEAVEEEAPAIEAIEEAPKEEQQPEIINEQVEEAPAKEEIKEEKPKRLTQKDRIQCPKCLKEMTVKSYRYSHEKNCSGQLTEKPVKPHANPKSKPKAKPKPKQVHEVLSNKRNPKPAPDVYYSDSDYDDSESDDVPQQPQVKNKKQPAQPSNPLLDASPEARVLCDITNSYALIQRQ